MRRARRVTALLSGLLCVVALLFPGCADPLNSQVTARVSADPSVLARLVSLHVEVNAQDGAEWVMREERPFVASELLWPVDFVIVPRKGTPANGLFELVLRAGEGPNGQSVFLEHRALVRFARGKQEVIDIVLAPCGELGPQGGLCELRPDCRGIGCRTCVDDRCRPTPSPDVVDFDAGEGGPEVGPDGGPDGSLDSGPDGSLDSGPHATDAGPELPDADPVLPDAPPARQTCETPGSGISCARGTACGGEERCAPSEPTAAANGCVPVAPRVVCPAGQTCSPETGACSTCVLKPDGDGDGAPAPQCGGSDCDDNDATRFPAQTELCNGRDDDCSGVADDGAATSSCVAPTNGMSACVSGACVPSCLPGYLPQAGGCVRDHCVGVTSCAPGSCVNGASDFTCSCPTGYRVDAQVGASACRFIDPCQTNNDGCSHGCEPIGPNMSRCSCPDGMLLLPDGKSCTKPDPCLTANGGCSHLCQSGRTPICSCPAGMSLGPDERTCSEVSPCLQANGGCSHVCNWTAGMPASCGCPTGMVLFSDHRTCVPAPPSCSAWSPASSLVSPSMPLYAKMVSDWGMHDQYICRAKQGVASIPGKINNTPTVPTRLESVCYHAYLDGSGFPENAAGTEFELFTPGASCNLSWVAHVAAPTAAIPQAALHMGFDLSGRSLYTCRVNITDPLSTGQHLGSVGATPGEQCMVQFFSTTRSYPSFEVLTLTPP